MLTLTLIKTCYDKQICQRCKMGKTRPGFKQLNNLQAIALYEELNTQVKKIIKNFFYKTRKWNYQTVKTKPLIPIIAKLSKLLHLCSCHPANALPPSLLSYLPGI